MLFFSYEKCIYSFWSVFYKKNIIYKAKFSLCCKSAQCVELISKGYMFYTNYTTVMDHKTTRMLNYYMVKFFNFYKNFVTVSFTDKTSSCTDIVQKWTKL